MSPSLAAHNKLSQPQLTTIVLSGMMSQYPIAPFVGYLVDRKGPAICSLIAAFLFVFGFGGFAVEVNNTAIEKASLATFYRLTFYFLLAGLGTVFSYCSSLFSASKLFPSHIGLASGASMALFGLSPFFLSVLATNYFTDPITGLLNVSRYMTFLAFLTASVYTFSALVLRSAPGAADLTVDIRATEGVGPGESTPLLASDSPSLNPSKIEHTTSEILKTGDFWLLAVFCFLTLGVSEMIISNIGGISMSLPHSLPHLMTGPTTRKSSIAFQVNLISIANTGARILVGILADFISPAATYLPTGVLAFPKKPAISRFVFLFGSAIVLLVTFIWMEVGVQSQGNLWALSIGTGLSYSTVFTVLPGLISSLWGINNIGRNFGIMMYAPFTGTPLFSYMYALISASHKEEGETICRGRPCWQLTFYLAIVASCISLFNSIILWRRWRGKI